MTKKKPAVRKQLPCAVKEDAPLALRAEARRWRAGMRAMNEIAAQEMRALTWKEKSRLIEALFESGRNMRWPDRTREDAEVAGRWRRLREALGAHG